MASDTSLAYSRSANSRDDTVAFSSFVNPLSYNDGSPAVAAVGNLVGAGTPAGSASVSLQTPTLGTMDQIANELTTGYWNGDKHRWNVSQGGTLTVDITGLSATERVLARAALQEWSDLIGIHFQEVTGGGQITFNDAEDSSGGVAQTMPIWSNGYMTSATIQISSSWITRYGTNLNSYSYQTYVHEIGHALGLGHPGSYNETATYPTDAMFTNDSWATSVMSYFSQHDNTTTGFSQNYAVTPMQADILAMQQLYGLSSTDHAGDTVYGYHSTAGGVYDASAYPAVALTIYDSGGNDTLDYSGATANQTINLNAETFSNVDGYYGNLAIARGVVIENAIGGSGDDTIIQNAANNVLSGGAGNDILSYATATGGVTVNLALTTAQNTGGAGIDTLSGFEQLIGSDYNDVLTGSATTTSLTGGAGDDILVAGPTNPAGGLGMYGGDGNDTFVINASETWVDGGSGFNIVDGSTASAGLILTTNGHTGLGVTTLSNVQEIIGSNYADDLSCWVAGDVLLGGAGDDTLTSYGGGASLAGGDGNDTYNIWSTGDTITETPGGGIDTVVSRADYTLPANVENLRMFEYNSSDPYAGASVPPPGGYVENWSGTGNELANTITGNAGNNTLVGLGGDDMLIGLAGADRLTGGSGNDTFLGTRADLNGDTITDFSRGDRIVFSDASLSGFVYLITGNILTYSGGSITLSGLQNFSTAASAAPEGGVQITFSGPPIIISAGPPVSLAKSGFISASAQTAAEAVAVHAVHAFPDYGVGHDNWRAHIWESHVNGWPVEHSIPADPFWFS